MARIIGIMGGIGTGKSFVCDLLEQDYNAYVIKADNVGHRVMSKGNISYNLIVEYFGNSILNSTGEINRMLLGKIVFNNKKELDILNKFTHPYIYEIIEKDIADKSNIFNNNKLIILEAALMLETGFNKLVNELWYVYSNINIRKKRLKKHRNYTDEKINNILSNQILDTEYKEVADYIIDNSYTTENTIEQIKLILK